MAASKHGKNAAVAPAGSHTTDPASLRAKTVARPALRSRTFHMKWREHLAAHLAHTLPWTSRVEWAAASGESVSHINACATKSEADRKTLRVVDVLFLKPEEREEIIQAIREWGAAIDRGDL